VLQSGSAVALNWANQHAAAILEAGIRAGRRGCDWRTLPGRKQPANGCSYVLRHRSMGFLAFTDYKLQTARQAQPIVTIQEAAVGFGYRLSYNEVQVPAR